MSHKIVIVGAGYAGMMSALRFAGKTRDADITLINASDQFVERLRHHQRVTGQALKRRPISALLRGKRVRFVQGLVKHIDLRQHTIAVDSQQQPIEYDTLVYALGSMTDRGSVPGANEHAIAMESPRLGEKLALLAAKGGRLLVVGGGLTGIESASEIAEAFPSVQVTLLTRGTFGSQLSQKGQRHLRRTFDKLGIEVCDNTIVTEVKAGTVVTNTDDEIPFDICVWTGSFVALPMAREAGFAVNARGQILIDPYLQSVSHPEVYAVGDAAAFIERFGAPIRMSANTALPMGAHAADNIMAQLNKKTPSPFSFAYGGRCVSLGRHVGLVQWVDQDDTPREHVTTGRKAAFFKEVLCKYSFAVLRLERLVPGSFIWMRWRAQSTGAYATEHS